MAVAVVSAPARLPLSVRFLLWEGNLGWVTYICSTVSDMASSLVNPCRIQDASMSWWSSPFWGGYRFSTVSCASLDIVN